MTKTPPTPEELNKINEAFWSDSGKGGQITEKMKEILGGEKNQLTADILARIDEAQERQVPIKNRHSLEYKNKKAISVLGQKQSTAGSHGKPDGLNILIEEIVITKPMITLKELLAELKRCEQGGVITDIADGVIGFITQDGTEDGKQEYAPISGLKHRLTRARKNL